MKALLSLQRAGVLVVLASLVFFSSCKKDDGPTVQETNTNLLTSGTWKVGSVKVDNVDRTSLFTGMTLQFTAAGYTTANGGPVWPATGTWSFTDDAAMSIKRNDDLQVTITSISESSLVLTLTWSKTTLGKGRSSSVAGVHAFSFTK